MAMQWEGIVGLAEEQVWGDGINNPTTLIGVISAGQIVEPIIPDDARATKIRAPRVAVLTGLNYAFNWQQWVNREVIGEALKYLYGSVQTSGGGPYTHTYAHATTDDGLPGFTFFVDRAIDGSNPTDALAGCIMNQGTFENAAADVLMATFEGVGRSRSQEAIISISSAQCTELGLDPFIFSELTFRQGLNGAVLSTDTTIENLSIVINNNIVTDKRSADGSLFIQQPKAGMIEITGSFDVEMEDYLRFDAFEANQQVDVEATWSDGTYSLLIRVPNARFTAHPLPDIGGNSDRAVVTVEFRGLYDCDDSEVSHAVLVNDDAAVPISQSSSSSSISSSSSSISSSSSSSST